MPDYQKGIYHHGHTLQPGENRVSGVWDELPRTRGQIEWAITFCTFVDALFCPRIRKRMNNLYAEYISWLNQYPNLSL